jgi:hypothetical protein
MMQLIVWLNLDNGNRENKNDWKLVGVPPEN